MARYFSYTGDALEITRKKGQDDDASIAPRIAGEGPVDLTPSIE